MESYDVERFRPTEEKSRLSRMDNAGSTARDAADSSRSAEIVSRYARRGSDEFVRRERLNSPQQNSDTFRSVPSSSLAVVHSHIDPMSQLAVQQAKCRMLEEKLSEQLNLCSALCQRANSLEGERTQMQADLRSAQFMTLQCEELCVDNFIHFEAVARTVMMLQEADIRSSAVEMFLRHRIELNSQTAAAQLQKSNAAREEAHAAFMALHEAVIQRAAVSSPRSAQNRGAPSSSSVGINTDAPTASTYRDLNKLSSTVLELSQELDRERAAATELRRALENVQSASPENSAQRNTRELVLEGEMASMKQLVQKEMQSSRTLRESESRLRSQVNELAVECKKLNAESLELHRVVQTLQDDAIMQKERQESACRELKGALQEARSHLSSRDSEIATLRSRVMTLESVERRQQEDLRVAAGQVEALQKKLVDSHGQNLCGEACRRIASQLDSANQELAAYKVAQERLEERLRSAESSRISLVVHQEEVSSLKSQLQDKQQHITLLEGRVSSTSAAADRSAAALHKAESDLKRATDSANEQKEDLRAAKLRIHKLEMAVEDARTEHGIEMTRLRVEARGSRSHRSYGAVDDSALEYAAKQLNLAAQQIDDLSAHNEQLQRRVQQLEAPQGDAFHRKPSVIRTF